ncbi:MAG: ribokinase [Propionibacteriaceae bacterium]
MGRVVVVGSLNRDVVVRVQRHPAPGETVIGDSVEASHGGKGANQAVAAAVAGGEVHFVGRVGDDPVGRDYLARLDAFGIRTAGIVVDDEAPTGTALIQVDAAGENSIVVVAGANGRVDVNDLAPLSDLTAADVLLLQLEVPTEVVVEAARRGHTAGARVIINLAPYLDLPAEVLARCDPVVVNEHERDLLRAAGAEPSSLLVTLGTDGSTWGQLQAPAQQVQARDTTGAGDAYCGTLAARLAAGDAPVAAMAAATRAAAGNVGRIGAQPAPPTS